MTFEIIEGLLAIQASVKGLACGRPKGRNPFGLSALTFGAADLSGRAKQLPFVTGGTDRGSNAIGSELVLGGFAQPIGGPWGVNHQVDLNLLPCFLCQGLLNIFCHHIHGGTAGVGWRQININAVFALADVSDDTQFHNGYDGNFWIGHPFKACPPPMRVVPYHVASG